MQVKRILLIILTLVIAACLSIIPLPSWANWLRPEWVTLMVCYWILGYPGIFNVGIAWCMGLLLDALYGTILGEHALAMTLVAYLVVRGQRILKHYPPHQQAFYIIVCSYVYNSSLFIVEWTLGATTNDWQFWIAPLFAIILWPVLCESMKKVHVSLNIA